jgi:predicted nucleic-acid-binding Zn-ribbon protein
MTKVDPEAKIGDCPKCGTRTFLIIQYTDIESGLKLQYRGKCYKCGLENKEIL